MLFVVVQRHDLHGDVTRRRILLELAQHRPAQHVGQEHVQRDRCRRIIFRERESFRAAHCDDHLESRIPGKIGHDTRIMRIILDDQQHGIAGHDLRPVIEDRRDGGFCKPRRGNGAHLRCRPRIERRPDEGERQIQGEGGALPRITAQLNLAAEQVG